ncbi:CapA family protein [Metabacillus bambusae]|uniref:CapA family protein n=1 Tax=Metabacillus bambusae TaxID=2795218 RepID=A0ABS3N2W5_9BACI|nr:CapA family protein [Metabacillus bambusae]MBO1512441.1 CapA family protein [Metabacillus bambusae]
MHNENNLNRTRVSRKRRRLKKSVRHFLLFSFLIIFGVFIYNLFKVEEVSTDLTEINQEHNLKESEKQNQEQSTNENKKLEPVTETKIKISAAGDFTLGTDERFEYTDSFVDEATTNGLSYFVEGLGTTFIEDDLTTVNLETTLTTATEKADKTFTFKGDPSYTQILELGGIEAVNLANNHIFDYLDKGFDDTISALEKQDIGYFGYDHQYIKKIKGVKIGALGYEGWGDTPEIRNNVEQDIKALRENGVEIILVHYHWGAEKQYVPNDEQKSLARYTIDSGADLILGHHPHVVKGIEEYKGKFIVYSLGNFMFGGNRNPSNKDTFVFQQTFHLKNGDLTDKKEINIVPFSISSVSNRNDYQPTVLSGSESDRVLQKIIDVSNHINGSDWIVYESDINEANVEQ